MHLLAAKPGGFSDEEGIIDLQQNPADIVILSAQDTSLGLLADVIDKFRGEDKPTSPSVRLANLVNLNKPAAYDLYEDAVLQHSRLIVVSLLGGVSYWQYGVDRLIDLASESKINLVIVPGDDQLDQELVDASNCNTDQHYAIWRYLREGGVPNTSNLIKYLITEFFPEEPTGADSIPPPRALPFSLIYNANNPDSPDSLEQWKKIRSAELPTVLLLFYRSHVQSGNTAAFDQFIDILGTRFNIVALAVLSLKNSDCIDSINSVIEQTSCNVVINTTSFSQHIEGNASLSSQPQTSSPLFEKSIPVIQAILAANSEQDWQDSAQGLRGRDIAMNIALPEFDGRIIGRAISFKTLVRRSEHTEMDVIRYQLNPERAQFIAELAYKWALLGIKQNRQKRIALVLANYPTRDGRIGNGVGLDTPASTINILRSLQEAGFDVDNIPQDGDGLISLLQSGVTNALDTIDIKSCNQSISIEDYLDWFNQIPIVNQQAIQSRWGSPESDPMFRNSRLMVPGVRLGQTFIGIQPARGFNVDVVANYHDPDLVPPHGYLAFYVWLRISYGADAIAHIGKHGNLEWLPGKSTALSENCWPDIALGPLPHLYPFIVNDPGEGAQAKRRAQAVIIDHLMPPMARAETYGELLELENLVDEYYQALGLDQRRETYLREKILKLVEQSNLTTELTSGDASGDASGEISSLDDDTILNDLDTYLCDLKESQIRHGLHRFGQLPDDQKLSETLVALTRLPRGEEQFDRGILHCLSDDLNLVTSNGEAFDPLKFTASASWTGPRPLLLSDISNHTWRTEADTRERLELLAEQCIEKSLSNQSIDKALTQTINLLGYINEIVVKAVQDSAKNEIANFIGALQGKFVAAGPSGAPTRGRLDVLPTGRNFYSLDSRSIPTSSAWDLGQRSAESLLARHLQENGEYPRQLGISVWGTSTMRTGGDDIAQALALMGVRPIWSTGSNRVTDIEIIPGFQLGRPRVDVTLRISGFFRDAFPNVAKLFDTAVQALADYEEPGDSNLIRQHVLQNAKQLAKEGMSEEQANIQSRFRVFGSKPGSYGAGLQGLIDEGVWNDSKDLAQAYVNWGGYSYTQNNFGEAAFSSFESRLSQIEVVVQNQDNREHDLLDSDDYYQFQGGMSNAIEVLRGVQPTIYHGDHSNPANPKIRTLKEELNKVIRSRVTNPKWISAMQQHGYKGGFEMAASVDYLFAYDATTNLIDDYQYEAVTEALILDPDNRQFMQQSNPHALKDMSERMLEAQQRGLWKEPGEYEQALIDTILKIDNSLEKAETDR